MWEPDWIRDHFPALQGSTTFLDNAAGAQLPKSVLEATSEAMTHLQVNKGGAYRESVQITAACEEVRARVASFINAPSSRQVAFGPNATTLIELVAQAAGRFFEPGDEIVVTGLDHHANIDPWRRLEPLGIRIRTWEPTGPRAQLDLDSLREIVGPRTRLLAMTAASNALGTLTPVAEAARLVHTQGGWVMVDAVHSAPHQIPDVQAMGADLLVLSPYKVFAPHLGVLYLGEEPLEKLPAPGLSFFPKGDQQGWQPGTQNHEAIVGFGGTFTYLDEVADRFGHTGSDRQRWCSVFDEIATHEAALATDFREALTGCGLEFYGLEGISGRTATFCLNVPGRSPAQVASALADEGIAVARGHYYAYDLMMKTLGLAERGGAVRVSFLHYNNKEDGARCAAVLRKLAETA